MTEALRRGTREVHARSPEAYRRELGGMGPCLVAAREEHVPVLPRSF